METHNTNDAHSAHKMPYQNLIWMTILSFIAMYILMYSMVDKIQNVIPNYNQFYMAVLMTSPMLLIEMILMRSMYKNRKLNSIIISASIIVGATCFLFIRNQTAISDGQFLKAMIPHHAAAILMVKESELRDPEVKKLANDIISSQSEQIDFMKAKIKELEK